jgi:hypothetical protein
VGVAEVVEDGFAEVRWIGQALMEETPENSISYFANPPPN